MNARRILFTSVVLVLLAALTLFAASCTAPTQGQSTPAPAIDSARTIIVVGRGEVYGEPDQARVHVGVDIMSPTVEEAVTENERTVLAIRQALETLEIADADVQTSGYSVWMEYRYGDSGPEGVAGYRVSNSMTIVIRDLGTVPELLAAVTDAGANSIQGIEFTLADRTALEEEARAAAVADARARAESLATLSGVEVGRILSISEVVGRYYEVGTRYGMGGAAEGVAPTISPGQLSIPVDLEVTFALE